MPSSLLIPAALAVGGFIVLEQIWWYYKAIRRTNGLAGYRTLIAGPSITARLIPRLPFGISLGNIWMLEHGYDDCEKFGYEAFSVVHTLPTLSCVHVCDPKAIKTLLTDRTGTFVKPVEAYSVLMWFGGNIVTAEGHEWGRHRKISAPGFTERNVALVCDVTVDSVRELLDKRSEGVVRVGDVAEFTAAIAIAVVARASFGIPKEEIETVPKGAKYTMSFASALEVCSTNVFTRAVVPPPLWGKNRPAGRGWLGKHVKKAFCAFDELETYMYEMVEQRRNLGHDGLGKKSDLLSNLVAAVMDEAQSDGKRITDRELISNIFIFLVAGHETTAHTLAFSFGLLGIHQDEQEKLYQHIMSVLDGGRDPVYADLTALSPLLNFLYETLRIVPSVPVIPKRTMRDTTLVIDSSLSNPAPPKTIMLNKGTEVYIHTVGLHKSPKYWKDPEEFRPSRFADPNWPREAFVPFSLGLRSCIGRRFAETEAVAAMIAVLQRYRVELDWEKIPGGKIEGENPIATRNRVFSYSIGITTTPAKIPVLLVPRKG